MAAAPVVLLWLIVSGASGVVWSREREGEWGGGGGGGGGGAVSFYSQTLIDSEMKKTFSFFFLLSLSQAKNTCLNINQVGSNNSSLVWCKYNVFAKYIQSQFSCFLVHVMSQVSSSFQTINRVSVMFTWEVIMHKIEECKNLVEASALIGRMFPSGVEEQFAIAEAKLRAWASVDEEDEEDSNDEDSPSGGQTHTFLFQSSGTSSRQRFAHFVSFHSSSSLCAPSLTKRLLFPPPPPKHPSISQVLWLFAPPSDATTSNPITAAPHQPEGGSSEAPPSDSPPGSSSSGSLLSGRPGSHNDPNPSQTNSPSLPSDRMTPFLEEEERPAGHGKRLAPSQEQHSEVYVYHKPEWRPQGRSGRFDSCYSTSYSESPGEEDEEDEDEEDEEGSVFHEARVWHCSPRSFFSDRASSGVASFDEEEEEREEREEREDVEEKKEEKEYYMWCVVHLYVPLIPCWFWIWHNLFCFHCKPLTTSSCSSSPSSSSSTHCLLSWPSGLSCTDLAQSFIAAVNI